MQQEPRKRWALLLMDLPTFGQDLNFAGVLANNVASPRHTEMIMQGMPPDLRYFGGIPRDSQFVLPERHLGLVQAEEVT